MSKHREQQASHMAPPQDHPATELQVLSRSDVGELTIAPDILPPPMSDAAKAFLAEAKGERAVPTKIPLLTINHKHGGFNNLAGEVVPFIEGYPIQYFHIRRFYAKAYNPSEKGAPPDCWSSDMIAPNPSSTKPQARTCAECKNSQFGTARDGRAPACGTFTWVFLLNPAFGNPPIGVLVAPPSSLRSLVGTRFQQGYFAKAASKHGIYETVWTKFEATKENDAAIHCVLEASMGPAAARDVAVKIAKPRNDFLGVMDSFRLKVPDVEDPNQREGEQQ